MRARLISGRYFVRFVVIEDQAQRRTICTALNQWMVTAAEKATGIGSHFATSLELTPATEYVGVRQDAGQDGELNVGRALSPATADAPDAHLETPQVEAAASAVPPAQSAAASTTTPPAAASIPTVPQFTPGAVANLHHPTHFPSGF
jgi:hypothetical protein